MIKTLNDRHCCVKVHKNQEATAIWVANRFKSLIEQNSDIKVKFLGREIKRIYGLTLPTCTLYRVKNRVLDKTKKEQCKSYNLLYRYGCAVRERNPGSTCFLKTITSTFGAPARFQRFFISFEAQKHGFLFGCRSFIGLDRCHLKGKHPGVLLAAIAINSNNGVFPLALCIAEVECKDS
ncbi:hypothetical protein ACOSQ2_009750 [Xanthoceras sorbifolium]